MADEKAENNKSKKGKFFLGALIGAAAAIVAGKAIKARMSGAKEECDCEDCEDCGCEDCDCEDNCSCKKADKKTEKK